MSNVALSYLGRLADPFRSCILLFESINNIENGPGPKSKQARERDGETSSQLADDPEKSIARPQPVHAQTHDSETDEVPHIAPVTPLSPLEATW